MRENLRKVLSSLGVARHGRDAVLIERREETDDLRACVAEEEEVAK